MATNHCFENGFLVDLDEILPTDPHVFWTGKPPLVGCSNIVCVRCGCVVRHVDGRSTPNTGSDSAHQRLYESSDPASSPILSVNEDMRAYFCRCEWADARAVFLGASDLPWRCDGHPDDAAGTWAKKVTHRAQLFQAARRDAPDATVAWEELAIEAAEGLPYFHKLMLTTESWLVRGRAAMAIGRWSGECKHARSVLAATVENSEDADARREAERLWRDIP